MGVAFGAGGAGRSESEPGYGQRLKSCLLTRLTSKTQDCPTALFASALSRQRPCRTPTIDDSSLRITAKSSAPILL